MKIKPAKRGWQITLSRWIIYSTDSFKAADSFSNETLLCGFDRSWNKILFVTKYKDLQKTAYNTNTNNQTYM